ncbi:MAG: tetratricopeptide repeat protein [Leptospiraceae bacterium]|nr:tetratricopeptide repeat protein [Leptospiraceae bacterium]
MNNFIFLFFRITRIIPLFLLTIYSCQSIEEKGPTQESKIDNLLIRGFTQFPLYTGRDFLGYINAEGQEKTFDKKLWRGKVKKDPIQQNIILSYSLEDLKELKGGFSEILSAEAGYETIQSLNLILENPVQYILEDLSMEPNFKNQKELFNRKYIGAVLKVDKINIELKNKNGVTLKTEADLKINNIKLGVNFQHSSSENSVFFAENAYVGYKLFAAPENPESLITEEDKRLKVVVFPFEIEDFKSRDEKLKSALADATARSLNMIENIFVLDRNSYQKILEEQQLAKSEHYDEKKAAQIGKIMTANTILIGKFSREGLNARITCNMIDVETNALRSNGSIKLDINIKGKNSPMIADEWEAKILESFGVKPAPKDPTSTSILGTNIGDAYDFYWKGKEKFILMDEESLEEAIPLFNKAIELDPNYAESYATLAETYQRLYDFKKFTGDRIGAEKMKIFGFEAISKALEIAPESSNVNRVISFYYFYLDPDYEKSKFHAQKAVELDPKDAEAAMRLFVIKARENKKYLSPDNKDLLSIYDLNPNIISTNFYMAQSYKLAGNYNKAIEFYQKILAISPKSISIYADISSSYTEQEKWEEALTWLDKADEIQPNNFQVQIHYANYFIRKKEFKKAYEYLNLAKKLQPKSTTPYEAIANISLRLKNYDDAIVNLQKCLELEPKKASFLNQLGNVYRKKGDTQNAINQYTKAIKLEPRFVLSYDNLANTYFSSKKFDLAIQNFEKCIELEPSNSLYPRAIAEAYIEIENYDTAISYYNKAQELDPNEHMIYNELGSTLVLKREYEAGKEKFERAIELGNDEVKSYGYKGLADLKRKQRKYEEAMDLYKQSINIFSDNQEAKLGLAYIYSKKGNNQKAIVILKSILEKDPQNAKAYFDLGKYYKLEKRMEESLESYKKACEYGEINACIEHKGNKKKKKK